MTSLHSTKDQTLPGFPCHAFRRTAFTVLEVFPILAIIAIIPDSPDVLARKRFNALAGALG
jgi:hypothetical protein